MSNQTRGHDGATLHADPAGAHPGQVPAEEVAERARQAASDPRWEFGSFFLSRFLDLDITYDDDQQTCTVRLPYAAHLGNPQGSVHGGVMATALDISMGHLCHRVLTASVTVEMQVRYLRPLLTGATCTARLVHGGRRLVHLESRMSDDAGARVAAATSTWQRLGVA